MERIDAQSETNLSYRFKPKSVFRSDVGKKRSENQDSYGYALSSKAQLYIVADGMGGARGGAVASAIAVNVIAREALIDGGEVTAESIQQAIKKANTLIFEKGRADENLGGMGTTVVAVAVVEEKLLLGYVGDSRVYRLRDGLLTQVTRDHTLVQELIDSGAISDEEAEGHPIAHMLTRSLGPSGAVEADVLTLEDSPRDGDIYLLCSDGLYNMVDDDEIATILRENEPETAADALIEAALEGGGTDNITVSVIQLHPASDESIDFEPVPAGDVRLVTSSRIDHLDLGELEREIAASRESEAESETNGAGSESIRPAHESIIFDNLPTQDKIDQHQKKVAAELGLIEVDAEIEEELSSAGEDTAAPRMSREQLKLFRMLLFFGGVIMVATIVVVAVVIFTKVTKDTNVASAPVAKPAVEDDASQRDSLTEELDSWSNDESSDVDAAEKETPVQLAKNSAANSETGGSGAAKSKQWPSKKIVPDQPLVDQSADASAKVSGANGTEAVETSAVKQGTNSKSVETAVSETSTEDSKRDLVAEQKQLDALVRRTVSRAVNLKIPPPPRVAVVGDAPPTEEIDWDVEKVLKEKVEEQVELEQGMSAPEALEEPKLMTDAEKAEIVSSKSAIRTRIADIDQKLIAFNFRDRDDAKTYAAKLRSELDDLNRAAAEMLRRIEKVKSNFSFWDKVQNTVRRQDVMFVVSDVSQQVPAVKAAEDAYREANKKYEDAVALWRKDSTDTKAAARISEYGRDVQAKRIDLQESVYNAIEDRYRQLSDELAKISTQLVLVDLLRDSFNRHIGFALGFSSSIKDRKERYAALLAEREALEAELAGLRGKVSDQAELAVLKDRELKKFQKKR